VTAPARTRWHPVCRYDELLPERGVAALVDGRPVAVFRTHDGNVYALSNFDPLGGAYVLSRGIVGSRDETPTVASPLYKHVYDLTSGRCLDDDAVTVPSHPVRVAGDWIEVALT
jgi:nitrite reductase (NADH) small subunit